jgi:phosphatidate cytidylyltransferase
LLKSRVLVALVGIPVGVAIVILGGPAFLVAGLLLTLVGLHEYYTLTRPYRPNLAVGYLVGLAAVAGAYTWGLAGFVGGLFLVLALLFIWGMGGRMGHHLVGRMSVTVLGVVWIAGAFGHLELLRRLDHGMAYVILVVGCSWVSDTFAFFFGRAFGRHRMAPRVSPKKSVEGAVAGLIGSVLFALAVKIYSPWFPVRDAVILGLVVGVTGQWGDLFESAVKRDLQVKDSGRLLGGHGGVLDRFDSLLFASVACYWTVVSLLPALTAKLPS